MSVQAIWNEIENKIGQNVWTHKKYIYQKYILQLYFTSAAKFFAFYFLRQGFFQRIGGTKCSRQTNKQAGWPESQDLANTAACLKGQDPEISSEH